MNRVLNATVQRTADHAAPEITLDPLEIVGGMHLFHFVQIFVLNYNFLLGTFCTNAEIRTSDTDIEIYFSYFVLSMFLFLFVSPVHLL